MALGTQPYTVEIAKAKAKAKAANAIGAITLA